MTPHPNAAIPLVNAILRTVYRVYSMKSSTLRIDRQCFLCGQRRKRCQPLHIKNHRVMLRTHGIMWGKT